MGPLRPVTKLGYNGRCVICGFPLVRKFPEDFPKDWKFCCNCHMIAEEMAMGEISGLWSCHRVREIYNKITLVK